jgi:hypothetical protein
MYTLAILGVFRSCWFIAYILKQTLFNMTIKLSSNQNTNLDAYKHESALLTIKYAIDVLRIEI